MLQAPASGYRSAAAGALGGIGIEGTALSSSPVGAGILEASRLLFRTSNVGPIYGVQRSYALSVRCVQHLLKLLFTKPRS